MPQSLLKKTLGSKAFGITCVCLAYFYLSFAPGYKPSLWWQLSNLIIIIISLALIYSNSNQSITIIKICGIFFLIFFGMAPIIENNSKTNYWDGSEIPENYYLATNLITILCLAAFKLVYDFFKKGKEARKIEPEIKELEKLTLSRILFPRYIPFLFVCFSIILWFNNFNIYNLLLRGGDLTGELATESKPVGLLVNNFLRPFCFSLFIFCVFIYKQHSKSKSKTIFWIALFGPIALAACFPTALARFAIAALYIPLVIVIFPKILNSGFHFVNAFISLFFTIFPLFNSFRNFNQDFSWRNFEFGFDFDFFLAGHFDAYQNFARTISIELITYGEQLLGALLFFIPRDIWNGKPTGSGELLAQKTNLGFSNISQSLPAEGYINFGFFGSIAAFIIFAFLSAKLDGVFWRSKEASIKSTFSLYYFQLVGLTTFILRGDLLNAIAYTTGFLLSMGLVCRIYKLPKIKIGKMRIW